MGARIAYITCNLPTKQITVNCELPLDKAKVAFYMMVKNYNNAVLEVKFKKEVSSYFILNGHMII